MSGRIMRRVLLALLLPARVDAQPPTTQALGDAIGQLTQFQAEVARMLGLVQAARNDQVGSFLEQLHLAAAKKQWEERAAAQGRAMPAIGN